MPVLLTRRRLLAGSSLAVGLSALGCASPTAPPRTDPGPGAGPGWRAVEQDWTDAARARDVPVRLYLPQADGTADAALPLVVFSHGIGGSRRGYSYLGRHWAAAGFASLHVQHVGSDHRLWRDGSLWNLPSRLQAAAQAHEALDRARDLRFAIDRLLSEPSLARIDPGRMVVAGHSYGANTALLLAGARVERPDAPADLHDERLRGAMLLSAPPLYGEPAPERILASVQVPTLHVTATDDVIRVPGYYSPAADRVAVYEQVGSADKALAVFNGGSHSMFTDRLLTGGVTLNGQVKLATQALTTAFLQGLLRSGHPTPLQAWADAHAPLLARFEQQGAHLATQRLNGQRG